MTSTLSHGQGRFLFALTAVAILGSQSLAHATVLTFDDLPPGLPFTSYNGLNWSNFFVQDGSSDPNTGLAVGVISPKNVIFNGFGNPADISSATPFDLNSFYLTAAWNDGLDVKVTDDLGDSADLIVSTSGPTFEMLNFKGITHAHFVASGGTPSDNFLGATGTNFAIDNLSINVSDSQVPEPASLSLIAVGGCALLARRRR